MRSPPEVSTPPGNSWTAAEKSSTEQAVKGPASISTVFTKLGRGGCWINTVDINLSHPILKEGAFKEMFSSPEPGHLLCNRSARWSLSRVWIVWAQHCDPPLAFSVNDHFPEKPETKIDLFTDLEIFVTWAPEPSDCPRRPSRCQPGGLEKMSGKLADCYNPGQQNKTHYQISIGISKLKQSMGAGPNHQLSNLKNVIILLITVRNAQWTWH